MPYLARLLKSSKSEEKNLDDRGLFGPNIHFGLARDPRLFTEDTVLPQLNF